MKIVTHWLAKVCMCVAQRRQTAKPWYENGALSLQSCDTLVSQIPHVCCSKKTNWRKAWHEDVAANGVFSLHDTLTLPKINLIVSPILCTGSRWGSAQGGKEQKDRQWQAGCYFELPLLIPNSQFSILNSQFSILNSQFSMQVATLLSRHCQFSILFDFGFNSHRKINTTEFWVLS